MQGINLKKLQNIIENSIKKADSDQNIKSYSATLFNKSLNKVAEKFGEEAIELVIAATSENDERLVSETADVLYHLLVLLRKRDINIQEVFAELGSRNNKTDNNDLKTNS